MDKQERAHANMEATDSLDTKLSKQRASIKWLLSKAFNNRVPENLHEPFYRDHEDQEHLKPPILGGLANAELYCLALANMYSDPNYHNLNHWNILQTFARKGVQVPDPTDCSLTETVLIQTNPLKMNAHMSVMEAMMVLYAREVVTIDRVSAAAQRFSASQTQIISSSLPHEDGLLCWINSACTALNKAAEDSSSHVPVVKNLQELCDGTAIAALISFYCPDALPRSTVRVGRVSSLQDCLHNLMLVHEFCQNFLPINVFHMMPEDVTYMRGSMKQNLIAMLADLFNMLEVHPVKCVKYPGAACGRDSNEHGVRHKRCLPPPPPVAIPDLRPEADSSYTPFTVPRSPSACGPRVASARLTTGRSACSTPERRSCSPQREEFVVHRGRGVTTLASVVRRDDDNGGADPSMTAAGRPSNWGDAREGSFAGRRSRRSSITDDSQLTVENFGGSQDRLQFAGRNPEKQLATVAAARKISAPAGPLDHNPPVRTSRQDCQGSIQLFYGDFQNGASQDDKLQRQVSQPQGDVDGPKYYPIRRQLSSDTITLRQNYSTFSNKGGGDGGFYINSNKDMTDGDIISSKLSNFTDIRIKSNGDQSGMQMLGHGDMEIENDYKRKNTSFVTQQPNKTTWQQQFMQQEHQPMFPDSNGDGEQLFLGDDSCSGGNGNTMAVQLNNIRLKLEEKRRRIEQEKRRMEVAVNRQRQQLGQQAFLQAVTRDMDDGNINLGDYRNTSDLDNNAIEQYQQSIAKMNSSLQDIQSDIARLASQQNQLQHQQQTKQIFHQTPTPQSSPTQPPLYQPNIPQLHSQFSSQHNISSPARHAPSLHNSSFGSTPHIPREIAQNDRYGTTENYAQNYDHPFHEQSFHQPEQTFVQSPRQFYLHENPQPQRRTWAQHAQISNLQSEHDHRQFQFNQPSQQYRQPNNESQRMWKSPSPQPPVHDSRSWKPPSPQPPVHETRTWKSPSPQPPVHDTRTWKSPSPQPPVQDTRTWNPQGFVLHDRTNQQAFPVHYNNTDKYHNGTENNRDVHNHMSYTVINPSSTHQTYVSQSPPLPSSPQRRSKTPQRQGSLPEVGRRQEPISLQQLQTPITAPPVDDMEPQNISFIGNVEDDALRQGINRLNISSGTRTYRIPSPTRPSLNRNSFQHLNDASVDTSDEGNMNEKGFYISFDNEQPKRPKPPLRGKKGSPKKDLTPSDYHSPERESPGEEQSPWENRLHQTDEPFVVHRNISENHSSRKPNELSLDHRETIERKVLRPNSNEPAALVIGELNPDPNSAEEMEKKKERIMLLSLQRRQRAEEERARAEAAAAARKARDQAVAEQRAARKEEQSRRRDNILRQYKLKKAIDEAEREGKVFDKSEFMDILKTTGSGSNMSGGPTTTAPSSGARLRNKASATRARPKTIHVDSGALQAAEGMLGTKQPSSTNLTAGSTMRRDYYRGSQDSLAERAGLYRDSPVDDRGGMSPGSGSSGGALGRRGSCKTSRERENEESHQTRGRSKYSTYQSNFRTGRKSSSLMNLCDSGLGRATPPRRAASPGVRTLGSPAGSGPGSLPGGVGKRRIDRERDRPDDASDVSSTHSSIMDYSGPRLYKQPASKSNRGIMLNAVEYCVFPGAVNAEAKRRVLEEIARSESKHFLVLFRDAGCQFRALYSYCPETDRVTKLYGTGPKHVTDAMLDKFFKYNSGSKCFSQVHTKHLTVTIDAFTIHNSLWQGKKVHLPSKKDMALVI